MALKMIPHIKILHLTLTQAILIRTHITQQIVIPLKLQVIHQATDFHSPPQIEKDQNFKYKGVMINGRTDRNCKRIEG